MRDLWVLRESEGLMLHHLEQLEDRWSIERNAAKDEGVQACSQGVDVCWAAPVHKHKSSEKHV